LSNYKLQLIFDGCNDQIVQVTESERWLF